MDLSLSESEQTLKESAASFVQREAGRERDNLRQARVRRSEAILHVRREERP